MASVSAFSPTQTSFSWQITGLEHTWGVDNGYEEAYVTVTGVGTSAPVYPPPSSSNNFTSTGSFSGLSAGTTYTVNGFVIFNGSTIGVGSTSITTTSPPTPSPLTGLTAVGVSTSQINASWNPSTNATRYNVAVSPDPPSGSYNIFTTSTSHSITGLAPATTYFILVAPYNGTVAGSGDFTSAATLSVRPSNFSWTYAGYHPTTNVLTLGSDKLSGYGFYISIGEWSTLTSSINGFRVYKGLGATTFTSVSSGTSLSASLFNQIVTGMSGLSPYFSGGNSLPSIKSTGSDISASDLNRFKNCMNSIA